MLRLRTRSQSRTSVLRNAEINRRILSTPVGQWTVGQIAMAAKEVALSTGLGDKIVCSIRADETKIELRVRQAQRLPTLGWAARVLKQDFKKSMLHFMREAVATAVPPPDVIPTADEIVITRGAESERGKAGCAAIIEEFRERAHEVVIKRSVKADQTTRERYMAAYPHLRERIETAIASARCR